MSFEFERTVTKIRNVEVVSSILAVGMFTTVNNLSVCRHRKHMEAVSGVRLAEMERERVKQLVEMGYYLNAADFLRDAVRSKLKDFEFVAPKKMPITKIKAEVLRVIKQKPNIYADEIAATIGIDIETVIKAIDELMKEKKVIA